MKKGSGDENDTNNDVYHKKKLLHVVKYLSKAYRVLCRHHKIFYSVYSCRQGFLNIHYHSSTSHIQRCHRGKLNK